MTQWCTMLFGDMHEVLNAGKAAKDVDWTMFWYGCILGMMAWGVMYYEVWRIPSTVDLPWWVWAVLALYQFFFATFPITMWQQYKQTGKFDNAKYPLLDNGGYLQGERQQYKQTGKFDNAKYPLLDNGGYLQ